MKDRRGHGIGVHLIGLLHHLTTNTFGKGKGYNHIIESINQLVKEIEDSEGVRTPPLLHQFEHCWT